MTDEILEGVVLTGMNSFILSSFLSFSFGLTNFSRMFKLGSCLIFVTSKIWIQKFWVQ